LLTPWESFYVIVGSSAAALTGLQFVVMALVADSRARASSGEISAFGSPGVVHFCAALFVCAALSAPWQSLLGAGIAIVLCGAAGVFYALVVMHRARRQKGYKPVFEDWVWHVAMPLIAYVALLSSGLMLRRVPAPSLFVIGAATLLLVFIGIHNAWDTVIYLTVNRQSPDDENTDKQ
jgi:hypothetical protein